MKLKLLFAAVLMVGVPAHLLCMEGEKVKLVGNDGKEFEVLKDEAQESETLKNLIGHGATGDIPVSVSSEALALLVDDMKLQHMRKVQGETAAWKEKNREFEERLEKLPLSNIIDLYKAADYLNVYDRYWEIAKLLAGSVPPRLENVAGEHGIKRPDVRKVALELLKQPGARHYGPHGLRQNLREAALYALDAEKSKHENVNEPSAEDNEELHRVWLNKADIAAIPRNLRPEIWNELHSQYMEIQGAIKSEEAILEYEAGR